jgi:hypothetical protein
MNFELVHDFPLYNIINKYQIMKYIYLPMGKSGTSIEKAGNILGRGRVNTSANLDFVPTAY